MQWAIVIAAFLAASVEFVEAFTLVADSPTADPGEHLEVYRRHHAHHLWYVLGKSKIEEENVPPVCYTFF